MADVDRNPSDLRPSVPAETIAAIATPSGRGGVGIVRISGPAGLRLIKGFHDEALKGQWKGHRSSRLGIQNRVIYKVEERKILVLVIDITPHDYRSKS